MLKVTGCAQSPRGMLSFRFLVPALLVLSLLVFPSLPAHAGTAQSSDELVACDAAGRITSTNAISGVSLPISYDSTGNFYAKGVDVAIFTGDTPVKEVDGLDSTELKVALGAVTNYDYSSGTPVVYRIEFRGHYGVVGAAAQDITEDWQGSGLYFTVYRPPIVGGGGGGGYPCTGATDPSGYQVILTFSKAVDLPSPADNFTVYVDGKADSVGESGPGGNNDEIILFLHTPVAPGDTVTADYSGGTPAWLYADGSPVPTFAGLPVTNEVVVS